MQADPFATAPLTVGLAVVAGILGQVVAHHMRIPGIVLLLILGVLLGPDVANIIQPETLGSGLQLLVGFAVAVILFEGGLNLDPAGIRAAQRPIRYLVTVGAVVTAAGGTVAAHIFMGWDWTTSFLFGTLVIVTGPTVVGPLLRRLKVEKQVSTVLEAEGVLIDPIGAIIAVVTLEVVLSSDSLVSHGIAGLFQGLALGSLLGVVVGLLLAAALRTRFLVPDGLENVLTLSVVLALFQVSNALVHESGIAAVTAAGIAVRFAGVPVQRDLVEFKEQLTVMLIGLLFVLLAADVRLEQVASLGWRGVATVLTLMFVVRPLCVWASTFGSDLTLKQRLFLSWIGPRGIVAAAVASMFASRLPENGEELRALVFLVIATTVLVAGLSGAWVAKMLGLKRKPGTGWVILGASELAQLTARCLERLGRNVTLLDRNEEACRQARERGLKVVYGDGMRERAMEDVELDKVEGAIALTPNEGVNFVFAQNARHYAHEVRLFVSLVDPLHGLKPDMVHDLGGGVLFGTSHDVELWSVWLQEEQVETEFWELMVPAEGDATDPRTCRSEGRFLGLILLRGHSVSPLCDTTDLQRGDRVFFALNREHLEEAHQRLRSFGWEPRVIDELEDASELAAPPSPA